MCPQNDDSAVCFETLATAQPTATALGLPIDTSWFVDTDLRVLFAVISDSLLFSIAVPMRTRTMTASLICSKSSPRTARSQSSLFG